jgi:hypothetical protein
LPVAEGAGTVAPATYAPASGAPVVAPVFNYARAFKHAA